MQQKKVILKIKRYRSEKKAEPFFQNYEVPYRDDMVLLDVMNYIKDQVDSSLTFRWSCRMGVCGSCGAMVNGQAKLTCATYIKELNDPVTVEPLQNFPIIKDLVVDITDFMFKLKSVIPWIVRDREKPLDEGEYIQKPQELEQFKQASMCINCMLCYSACPVFGIEDKFIGPAAIALGYRYTLDSRDEGTNQRFDVLLSERGVWECTLVGECSTVCPKHVDPMFTIQRLKIMGAKETVRSILEPPSRRQDRI
ncbi:MAG: succinate dehydrogenase iron-sulfur subunit [Candidatus Bathyarchaeia archaeon]